MTRPGPVALGLCLLTLFGGGICRAQSTSADAGLFNWYYAAVFGTGVYRSGSRTITMVNLPLSHTVREATAGHAGIRLTLPVTLGFHDIDNLDIPGPEQLGTVSVMPGAEFPLLMRDDWTLTPYFNLGVGRGLSGDDTADATIYATGLKSRWQVPLGNTRFMLGNTLDYAGYDAKTASSTTTRLVTGFNLFTPATGLKSELVDDIGLHLIHYQYLGGLRIRQPFSGKIDALHSELEFAVTLGRHKGWELFGLRLERVGIGLRGGRDLSAVRLITGFPY